MFLRISAPYRIYRLEKPSLTIKLEVEAIEVGLGLASEYVIVNNTGALGKIASVVR